MEKLIIWFMLGAMLVSCGGEGGGGGGWPTRWKDVTGNDNFMPDLGETAVVTLAYDGDISKGVAVYYSATEPDLLFVGGWKGTMGQAYAGKISTGRLDAYCNPGEAVNPLVAEGRSALFTFMGGDLVIFGVDGERFVCGPGTTKSRARATYFSVSFAPVLAVRDGFWFIKQAPPAEIIHVRHDGTDEKFTAPAGDNFLLDARGGAFYFMLNNAAGEVIRFDAGTAAATVVGTGFLAGTPTGANAQGFFANISGPASETTQYVTFAQGTTPKFTPIKAHPFAGSVGGTPFYVDGGAGVVIGGRRYDTTTGAEMQANVANAIVGGQLVTPHTAVLAPSGHFYLLTGDFREIGIASRAATSNAVTLDAQVPDFKLKGPSLTSPQGVPWRFTLKAFDDGTCLVATVTTNGLTGFAEIKGSTLPAAQFGTSVAVTRCGSTSGKLVMVGTADMPDLDNNPLIPVDRPLLSAVHKRQRDKECAACNLDAWEARTYQLFVSAWTVTPDGAPKPLFAHANSAWLRSHSLANFVVRHEDKLVVVAGDGP